MPAVSIMVLNSETHLETIMNTINSRPGCISGHTSKPRSSNKWSNGYMPSCFFTNPTADSTPLVFECYIIYVSICVDLSVASSLLATYTCADG
jgi:hypothetical protein